MNDIILLAILFFGFLGWGIWQNEFNQTTFSTFRWREPFWIYCSRKAMEKEYFLKFDWEHWQAELKMNEKFKKAKRWADLYGGAGIVLNSDWREEFLKDIKMFKPRIDHDNADAFSLAILGLSNARRK